MLVTLDMIRFPRDRTALAGVKFKSTATPCTRAIALVTAGRRHGCLGPKLLQPVVRRFLGDHHVVHMRLSKTRARDPYELRALLQRLEAFAPAVAHSRPYPADELE